MTMRHAFRLLNVFAETPLAGNPLCVFESSEGLDTATMQALALQFNLSETTFIQPSTEATAKVRIFTPTFEMPFAGHPTLGTAHVVRDLFKAGNQVALAMKAGVIPVSAVGDRWTLSANPPHWRAPAATREQLAMMLGLADSDIGESPLWVDAGSEQLLIPLTSFAAVRNARPGAAGLAQYGSNGERAMAYVFAREGDAVLARFFFPKHESVLEDPGTGSACANLGGWLIATGAALPQRVQVSQGEAVNRPCGLGLEVTAERAIRVSGQVIEIGRGSVAF
jgi:trans-2,3-dihydro-3-hydroxyanthranilate isomerase